MKAGDYGGAVDAWTATWPAELDSVRTRLKGGFARLVDVAGIPRDYELVREVTVTDYVRRYDIVLRTERDPAFLVLEAYRRPDDTWTVEHIQYNVNLSAPAPIDAAEFLVKKP